MNEDATIREIAPGLYETVVYGLGPAPDDTEPSPTIDEQLLGIAEDMLRGGRMSQAEYEAMQRLLASGATEAAITPQSIRDLRKTAGITQARFAEILGVTLSTANKWERGVKSPTGSALKLLGLAKRHGLSHIM
ncbi:hypothetical protein BH11ARM2_BH11ARM2_07070 [soil metagenome]